jgi:hypothetical protein
MSKPDVRFSKEVFDAICEQISEGVSLRKICEADNMPAKGTVMKWLVDFPELQDQYTRARELQAETIFDEMLDIADDGSNDWMEKFNPEGQSIGWQINGEHVQRSRLRLDSRKWQLSKMLPKKYGDKMDVTSGGAPIATVTIIPKGEDPD